MGFENKFRKKNFSMRCGAETMEDKKSCNRECKELYLWVKIDKEDRQ